MRFKNSFSGRLELPYFVCGLSHYPTTSHRVSQKR
uniref:Uncharacterized protein n=1 Tax=Anguilla anguilla TaxID=7936 RepID=A0A0E9W9L3_ANGAN